MSREAIVAFYKKVESDKRLQTKLLRVAQISEKDSTAKVVKIAAAAGFEFTPEEFATIRRLQFEYFQGLLEPKPVSPDCCLGEVAEAACCYYAQGCMPGFCPIEAAE